VRAPVRTVVELVEGITPLDAVEDHHRCETLRWLAATDDVFRRIRPATPPRHLVSYVVPVSAEGDLLLGEHHNAGLWLPPGGHVEPDEHPARTAAREAVEELGVADPVDRLPAFLTLTRTVGIDHGHEDVSLWFRLPMDRDRGVRADPREFGQVRWWSPAEIREADPAAFDPHLGRFLTKLLSGQ